MKLYDQEIKSLQAILDEFPDAKKNTFSNATKNTFPNAVSNINKDSVSKADILSWPLNPRDEIVLKSETGLELGTEDKIGVSGIAVTFDKNLVKDSGVFVRGCELQDLKKSEHMQASNTRKNMLDSNSSEGIHYARFVLVRLKENETLQTNMQSLYESIRKLDYLKYHLCPDGFSMRVSSLAFRENVRIKKEALKNGISFQRVGSALLSEYLKLAQVEACQICFFADTACDEEFGKIRDIAQKCESITESLNTIYDGLPMDCSVCSQKAICDEIDGMKELHLNIKAK